MGLEMISVKCCQLTENPVALQVCNNPTSHLLAVCTVAAGYVITTEGLGTPVSEISHGPEMPPGGTNNHIDGNCAENG